MTPEDKLYTKALLDTYRKEFDIKEITLDTRVFTDDDYKDEEIDVSSLTTDEILKKLVNGNNEFLFKGQVDKGMYAGSKGNHYLGAFFVSSKNPEDDYDEELTGSCLVSARSNMLGDFSKAYVVYEAIANAEKAVGNDIEKPPYSDEQLESIKYVLNRLREENIDIRYINRYAGESNIRGDDICDLENVLRIINYKAESDNIALYEMKVLTSKESDKPFNMHGFSTNKLANLFFNPEATSSKPSDLFDVEMNHLRIKQDETPQYQKVVDFIKDCDRELGYGNENTPEM